MTPEQDRLIRSIQLTDAIGQILSLVPWLLALALFWVFVGCSHASDDDARAALALASAAARGAAPMLPQVANPAPGVPALATGAAPRVAYYYAPVWQPAMAGGCAGGPCPAPGRRGR